MALAIVQEALAGTVVARRAQGGVVRMPAARGLSEDGGAAKKALEARLAALKVVVDGTCFRHVLARVARPLDRRRGADRWIWRVAAPARRLDGRAWRGSFPTMEERRTARSGIGLKGAVIDG